LHIEQSLQCIDIERGPCNPVVPHLESAEPLRRERLVDCAYFSLHRWQTHRPFAIGGDGKCRVLTGVNGWTRLQHAGQGYSLKRGDVVLLPAELGPCECIPEGEATFFECGVPKSA
jgi:mannose-6-phosphate isomerase